MKKFGVAIVFALLSLESGCKSAHQTTSGGAAGPTPQTRAQLPVGSGFDYYLLNLSWSPEFCYSHPNAAECSMHSTFLLHGLWPQNNDGTYPENCSSVAGPADVTQYKDIYPDLGLLRHEWQTHGTCSGLSADAFLQTARAAVREVTIPPALSGIARQISMPPDEIAGLFAASNPKFPKESFVVSCGHNFLTAVEVCMDKNLRPITCPAVRSCGANTVRIPAP